MAKKRKSDYHRGEPSVWGKVFKILGLLVVVGLIFAGSWALTLLGPKKVNYREVKYIADSDIPRDVSAMLDKSVQLEKAFVEKDKAKTVTPDDLPSLRQAIQLQKDYLDKTSNHNLASADQRLESMTILLDSYETKPMRAQSIDLEDRAKDAEARDDLDTAKKLLAQAAALEEKIIRDYSKSDIRTSAMSRAVLLQRHVRYLTALPLNNQSQEAEITAKAAVQRRDWPSALKNYQLARDSQYQLNTDFPDQRFTNTSRVLQLDQELAALKSLPEHEKIEQLISDGKAADAAGEYLHAAELYQEAQRRQRDLIANNKNSRFADPAVVDMVEGLRQTALSRALATEIQSQAEKLGEELRQRQIKDAADLAAVLVVKVQQFHENYPRSQILDSALLQRIDYLNSKRANFGDIQEQVYTQLLPLPGAKQQDLYRQEVPQELYQAVTGSNPSRNQGPKLPVDSISWNEAQNFCRRLSWILSRPVQLPTIEQFHTALGKPEALDPLAMSWNLDNSKGSTQPVGTKSAAPTGFYDLIGNVAEWLQRTPDNDDDEAPVIGGSVQTPIDTIRAAPSANLPVLNRNPYIGFRFVVNMDDAVPVLPPASDAASSKPPASQ